MSRLKKVTGPTVLKTEMSCCYEGINNRNLFGNQLNLFGGIKKKYYVCCRQNQLRIT